MVLTEQTVLAARRARARSVCHIRDLCPILGARWLRRHCLNHCGRVIAISDAVRRDLIDRIGVEPDRIERVYDGLQLAAPRERSDAFFTGTRLEGLRRVGVVARLSREKGQDTFLEAAARVAQEMDDVGFVIAGDAALGDGAYARELVDQAERLGLSGRTLFTGFTERVPELMAGLDALVVPSHTEPFGLVTVEAMAAGVPVVATDSGGSPELVEHGATGLLVLPRDPGRMAEAVISLLRDREHASAMAAAGCERARERFGIERHIGAMRDVYDHALEAK